MYSFLAKIASSALFKKAASYIDYKIILIIVLSILLSINYYMYSSTKETLTKKVEELRDKIVILQDNNHQLSLEIEQIEIEKTNLLIAYNNQINQIKENNSIQMKNLKKTKEEIKKIKEVDTKTDFKSFFIELKELEK